MIEVLVIIFLMVFTVNILFSSERNPSSIVLNSLVMIITISTFLLFIKGLILLARLPMP